MPNITDQSIILVFDVGSSSVKAGLYDKKANLIEESICQKKYSFDYKKGGWVEISPICLISAVEDVIDETLKTARSLKLAKHIHAVAFCTFVSNCIALDHNGLPLTPVITYADTRAETIIADLDQIIDFKNAHSQTGCRIHPAYWPAQIFWNYQSKNVINEKVKIWTDVGSYFLQKWFETIDIPMSLSISSWTGLLNLNNHSWYKTLCKKVGLKLHQLPKIASSDYFQKNLSSKMAIRWPELKKIPFFFPIGDGAAASLGSQCIQTNSTVLTIGTSSAIRILIRSSKKPLSQKLWTHYLNSNWTLIGASLTDGGNLFSWCKNQLLLPPLDKLDVELNKLNPMAHGLVVNPNFSGASPSIESSELGFIKGIKVSTSSIEILQALLESLVYCLKDFYELLQSFIEYNSSSFLIVNGGAFASSSYLTQLTADIFGVPVFNSFQKYQSLRGVALFVLESLKVVDFEDEHSPLSGKYIYPKNENKEIYFHSAKKYL